LTTRIGSRTVPGVRLEGITTVVDDAPVLHRLTLDVPPGVVTVLMGPSGSGKTTLIKHITGMLEPDRGTVTVGGRNVWEADPAGLREIRKTMSVMLGGSSVFDTSLFGSLSAFENLNYSLKAHDVPEKERDRRGMQMLADVGLGDKAADLPDALPAHARKRLALARALVCDTPLVILDDIEAGLDSAHAAKMISAIEKWRERTNGTVLLTTHDIKLAREFGENLAILGNGRIVTSGEASELLDGVDSSDEFDRRFAVSDLWGPLDMNEVQRSLDDDADDDEQRGIRFQYNPQLTLMVAAAIVIMIVVFVTAKLTGAF
jgi:phospholipid/cholesterol/gamma-HCH transport system ATP-binding protein